jgi:hypothetical protein
MKPASNGGNAGMMVPLETQVPDFALLGPGCAHFDVEALHAN